MSKRRKNNLFQSYITGIIAGFIAGTAVLWGNYMLKSYKIAGLKGFSIALGLYLLLISFFMLSGASFIYWIEKKANLP